MHVLTVIVILAVLAGLVYSAVKVNSYSKKKYGYAPFNISNFLAMVLAVLIAFLGVVIGPEIGGTTLSNVIQDMKTWNIKKSDLDALVLFAVSLIIVVVVYIRLLFKTNFLIATYAVTVQFLFAAIVVVILWAVYMSKHKKAQEDKRA